MVKKLIFKPGLYTGELRLSDEEKRAILGQSGSKDSDLPIKWVTPMSEENIDFLVANVVSLDKDGARCNFTLSDKEFIVNIPISAFEASNVAVKEDDRIILHGFKLDSCILGWIEKAQPPSMISQRLCNVCKEATSMEDWMQDGTQCPVCGEIAEWEDVRF